MEINIEKTKFCLNLSRVGKRIKKVNDGIESKIVPYDKSITF